MKPKPKPRREPKAPKFVAMPFRLRAITLALLAFAAGVLALVIALTPAEPPNFLVPRAAKPEPPWPDGFVELDPDAWPSALLPAPSAAPPSSASSMPARSASTASSARVESPE